MNNKKNDVSSNIIDGEVLLRLINELDDLRKRDQEMKILIEELRVLKVENKNLITQSVQLEQILIATRESSSYRIGNKFVRISLFIFFPILKVWSAIRRAF